MSRTTLVFHPLSLGSHYNEEKVRGHEGLDSSSYDESLSTLAGLPPGQFPVPKSSSWRHLRFLTFFKFFEL